MKHFKIKVLFFMSGRIPDRLLISAKYVRVLRRGSLAPPSYIHFNLFHTKHQQEIYL